MRFRTPELIPLLFIILAVGMTTSFGIWQVVRLDWKESLIHQIDMAQSQPTLGTLPETLDYITYHNVVLTGQFLHNKTLRRVGGKRGMPSGFFLMTPFALEDDGRVILVDRGFAPADKESNTEGIQTVSGILRPYRDKRFFSPENKPEDNLWFYENVSAMSNATSENLLPLIVRATGERIAGVYPIPHEAKITLRNDHLGYAITWFSLAIIALIMFAFYYRKKEEA